MTGGRFERGVHVVSAGVLALAAMTVVNVRWDVDATHPNIRWDGCPIVCVAYGAPLPMVHGGPTSGEFTVYLWALLANLVIVAPFAYGLLAAARRRVRVRAGVELAIAAAVFGVTYGLPFAYVWNLCWWRVLPPQFASPAYVGSVELHFGCWGWV